MRQQLSPAIDDYFLYRKSIGIARNTHRNDKQTLVALLAYAGNVYCDGVSHQRVTEFLADRAKTRSVNSLRVDYMVLRAFYDWACETRRCRKDRNPMAGRRVPKLETRERARVSVSDFPHLLECAGKRHPRDRAFVALSLLTMLRSSEVCSLRVGDLRLSDGRIMATLHKTKDVDEVPIPAELDREMRRWLAFYSQECGNLDPTWFLVPARKLIRFPGQGGDEGVTRLNPDHPVTHSAGQIVKPALKAAGFQVEGNPELKYEGAHTLRRSAARALYDRLASEGHDGAVRVVKTVLHHQSMNTTEGYLGTSGDKARRDDTLMGREMFGLPGVIEIGTAQDGDDERQAHSL